ncbi:MAG TPA: ABC transporter permease [Solirubrobacteraceae bacterium]|jgi:ABC-2 type transport system permease protein
MLRKDLVILRRSRLLVGVLVLYPVLIALLIGFAISRAPAKPKVAIVNLSPPGQAIEIGNNRLGISHYTSSLTSGITPVALSSRAAAVQAVSSGRVLAAVVLPADITQKLSSVLTQAHIEILYNGNALEQSFVQSTINSALAQANLTLSQEIKQLAAEDIDLILKGGNFDVLGSSHEILGLKNITSVLHEVLRVQPPGPVRSKLERVSSFAEFAAQNLDLSKEVLATVSQPIQIKDRLLHGDRTPLDSYAVVVAVSISLMFICVLLAAGGLALEREEHTLARLTRGPPALVSRSVVLAEKTLLAGGCSFLVAFGMLAGISAFVHLDWGRAQFWLLSLAAASLAFGALGIALGALAREVRAASLLAFLLALPLAFLALVPAGSVAGGLYEVIRVVSFVFPFKAALEALDAAVNRASPGVGVSVAHLAGLTAGYVLLARGALSRST